MKIDEALPVSSLECRHGCLLFAVGDVEQLTVYRSVVVLDSDEIYRPVAEFVQEHGMALVSWQWRRDTGMFFSAAEAFVFRSGSACGSGYRVRWLTPSAVAEKVGR